MGDISSNDYFIQKEALLKECVSLSEDLLSSIHDVDVVNRILSARSEKIRQLQELDDTCDSASLSTDQKSQINQIVSLLLGLDRDAIKQIKADQTDVMNEMRANTQNHKMIGYKGKRSEVSGRNLDIKK